MMPTVARQKRDIIQIVQFTRVKEIIFHDTPKTLFRELSQSWYQLTVEKHARIWGRNKAFLSTAPNSRFSSASQAISNEKTMVSQLTSRTMVITSFLQKLSSDSSSIQDKASTCTYYSSIALRHTTVQYCCSQHAAVSEMILLKANVRSKVILLSLN